MMMEVATFTAIAAIVLVAVCAAAVMGPAIATARTSPMIALRAL
jgi:hypothetical protein